MKNRNYEDVLEGLTEKMKVFVMEYCADGDGVRSCKEAGYNGNRQVLANRANRLLNNEKVKRAIAEIKRPYMEEAGLTVEHLTLQLKRFLNRNLLPYLDDEGNLTCSLRDLPEEIQQCVNGVKVKRKKHYDEEGNLVGVDEYIDLQFVDKMAAANTLAKHLGMFQDVQLNDNRTFINYGDLYDEGNSGEDVIEGKFKELENGKGS